MSKSLVNLTAYKKTKHISGWWEYVQHMPGECNKCRTIIRLLLDCHQLNVCTQRYDNGNALCKQCNMGDESVTHILYECSANVMQRNLLWENVMRQSPNGMKICVNTMSNIEKTKFILSGLNNMYCHEWTLLYKAVSEFINEIYFTRVQLKQ